MKKIIIILLAFAAIFSIGCKEDFLETAPSDKLATPDVFKTVDGAHSVINGILRDMRVMVNDRHDQFSVKAVDLATDLMAGDILVYNRHWFIWDYLNDNNAPTYRRPGFVWGIFYEYINNSNYVLQNIDGIETTETAFRDFVKAEALTIRAYSYFQLIQLFQNTYKGNENAPGVPIYKEPSKEGAPRSSVKEVYDLIVSDLDAAIGLFSGSDYGDGSISTPDLAVAKGMRARVALVMQDWAKAAKFANEARSGKINSADEYASGFGDAAKMNWIWGLPVNDEQSTIYASFFSHLDPTVSGYAGLGYSVKCITWKGEDALIPQMQEGDVRKSLLKNSKFGVPVYHKFAAGSGKKFSADYVMMRPEELLLIEAEALANQGNIAAAQTLLQTLWNNRIQKSEAVTEIPQVAFADKQDALNKIYLERRIELWGEGFRLKDVKRLMQDVDRTKSGHDYIPGAAKVFPAGTPKFTYVIPQTEIDNNPNINEENQNPLP